jgi:hypothetical protein
VCTNIGVTCRIFGVSLFLMLPQSKASKSHVLLTENNDDSIRSGPQKALKSKYCSKVPVGPEIFYNFCKCNSDSVSNIESYGIVRRHFIHAHGKIYEHGV